METNTLIIVSIVAYKIAALSVGTVFAALGYRLFVRGVWGDAGTIEAGYASSTFIVKRAAPGTFFALFGTVIVAFTIYQGVSFTNSAGGDAKNVTAVVEDDVTKLTPTDPATYKVPSVRSSISSCEYTQQGCDPVTKRSPPVFTGTGEPFEDWLKTNAGIQSKEQPGLIIPPE